MITTTDKRLREIMSERKLKQVDIINMSLPYQKKLNIKMSKSHLSQYVNGKSSPDQHKLYLLAETLNVSEAWLLGYDVEKERQKKRDSSNDITSIYNQLNKENRIKVYDFAENKLKKQNIISEPKLTSISVALKVAASRNTNGYGNDNDTSDFEEVYTDREDLRNFDYAYYVYGDSMEPKFKSYDVVLVQRAYDVDNGSIYVVMHEDELFVKQVRINDGIFTMHSLNEKYDDINIQLDDAESYPVIIGKVVDSITPLQIS